MTSLREDRLRADAAPLIVSVGTCLLACMLQQTNGHYDPKAIPYAIVAWVLILIAAFGRIRIRSRLANEQAMTIVLGGVLAIQLGLMITSPPTIEMRVRNPADGHLFNFMLVTVSVLAGIGVASSDKTRASRLWFPAIVLLHFAMGRLVLSFVPSPAIDVWTIEMESVKTLVEGHNPFAMTFADPYGGRSPFFAPDVSVNGRLMFGFPYPPLSLLLCVPGYLLGGDTRWSLLFAMEVAALLMGYARVGRVPKLAAIAFLFMPRTFFVMDRAWTDPFVVMFTAGVCFTALRAPRWTFVAIGLYICVKQQMVIGIPALFLLLPRPIPWRAAGTITMKAVLVAAAATLPLVLWSPRAFAHSVLVIKEVFRSDSLTILAHLHNIHVATLSKWTGVATIPLVAALGTWRGTRTPGGFALLAGATHFSLYIWSTHGFCNEYYTVVGTLFCAVAVWGPFDGTTLFTRPPTPTASLPPRWAS